MHALGGKLWRGTILPAHARKTLPPGMRDNNEYDLVCTRCGKSF